MAGRRVVEADLEEADCDEDREEAGDAGRDCADTCADQQKISSPAKYF